MCIQSVLRE